jgi:broad specificity phosphatase PhoE
MKLFFARHGKSEANVLRVVSNRDVRHDLTELGRTQATGLAEGLTNKRITNVYSSPIVRARETAEIVGARLRVPISLADGLREFDCGVLEGRGDEEAWEQHRNIQKRWYDLGEPTACIEGGESLIDVQERFWKSLDEVERRHGGRDEGVLLVTHGALLYSMMPEVFPNVSRDKILEYGLTNATVVEGISDGANRICLRWNDHRF